MNLLYCLFVHDRPSHLRECLRTIFHNNDLRPDRILVIHEMRGDARERMAVDNALAGLWEELKGIPADYLRFEPGVGYGNCARFAFTAAEVFNPRFLYLIETDYVFRKHGLDEVNDLLDSDLGKDLAGVAGYSHPDFFDPVAHARYAQEAKSYFGRDYVDRTAMFKPFEWQSKFGPRKIQRVTNSCGTIYLNWQAIPRARRRLCTEAACRGVGDRMLSDGILSQGIGYITGKPLADIIPSVADHHAAGGFNGKSWTGHKTPVSSPSFPAEYMMPLTVEPA